MTQNGGKVFVLVTLIFNNVRGQSCPSGLYYTTVSDINDCIACPEQSIGCTADLNVKTLDSCLACPFGELSYHVLSTVFKRNRDLIAHRLRTCIHQTYPQGLMMTRAEDDGVIY